MKLRDIILEDGHYWTKFKAKAEELENELQKTFNREDINVSIIQHSSGDYAMGKVEVRVNQDLPNEVYDKMKDFLKSKGFEITGGLNMADDDGDRLYHPDIKFQFKT
tara:strand:+ start:1151 stop:1471 length:321 start_codon:yes stop_codon:yes gene_type:complete